MSNNKNYAKKIETEQRRFISRKPKKRLSQTKNKNLPVEQVLHLQRTFGNEVVRHMFDAWGGQSKLKVNTAHHTYRQEAEKNHLTHNISPSVDVLRGKGDSQEIKSRN